MYKKMYKKYRNKILFNTKLFFWLYYISIIKKNLTFEQ